jgi:hypothetical protein
VIAMSKPSRLFAGVALFVFGVACGLYLYNPAVAQEKGQGKAPAAAVTKWEYRIVTMREHTVEMAEKELNQLGEQGFEIAFVTNASRGGGGGGKGAPEMTVLTHYTLKRAKQ